jgi:uncharacterized protein YegJ (DUF2314 family)
MALLLTAALALPPAAAQPIVERSRRDEVVRMQDEDPAMDAALRKAKLSLDDFLRTAASPPDNASSFAVKIAVSDGKDTEYFWIVPFTREGDSFRGTLGNTPRLVRHVRQGQEISFSKSQIVDWMYVDVDKRRLHGNFTACALLTKEKKEEAAKFRKLYGLECDP